MIGINGYELLVLAILAVVVLGPERLPEYASQLARLVREIRRMANGARDQLREEVGPEIDEVDWRKLDPRQYDPRRIIKEALLDDFTDAIKPVSARPAAATPQSGTQTTRTDGAGIPAAPPAVQPLIRLQAGEHAPFDTEAT